MVHRNESSPFLWQSACMRLHWQPQCSMPPAANPQPYEHQFSGSLLYALCIWEISCRTSQEDRACCLFFGSTIEAKVFLSHCMKWEEQGGDSRSPKAPTLRKRQTCCRTSKGCGSATATSLLRTFPGLKQFLAVAACVIASFHLQASEGCSGLSH